ncbi:MAG: 5'-nucleotidase C-terminal domain-containing protein [Archangium sp.]
MSSRSWAVLASALSLSLFGCPEEKKSDPTPPVAAPTPNAPAPRSGKVTILVTGHETGGLVKNAPRLLAQWRKEGWPDALAFSTGDSFAGATISSHFEGIPTAEVMKAMQYKASAFGNHDMDLGFTTLGKFREASGVQMLAANMQDKDTDQPLKLVPSAVFTREGIKVGVIGFTSMKTLTTTESGRAAGLSLLPLENSVGPALESLKKDSPDVTIALIDDCFPVLKTVLDAHKDWKVDLVVGTRCENTLEDVSGATKYFSADDTAHFVSAKFELKADGSKTLVAERKEVPAAGEEDADLVALRDRWQKQLDEVMGEKLGFSKAGIKAEGNELRTLVAVALRDQLKADAALINKKAIRAAIAKGPVTRATVYDIIPFENAAITVKLKGEVLTKFKSNPEAFIVAPAKIENDKDYVVATTEYIYFGGDGLGLEVVAPDPDFTGQVWQTPVIEWLRSKKTDEKKPLETLIKTLK